MSIATGGKKAGTVAFALAGATLSLGLSALLLGQRTFNHIVQKAR
jgi:hypothetical protein